MKASGCDSVLAGCCWYVSTLVEKRAELRRLGLSVRFSSAVKNWLPDVESVQNCVNDVAAIPPVAVGNTWRDRSYVWRTKSKSLADSCMSIRPCKKASLVARVNG